MKDAYAPCPAQDGCAANLMEARGTPLVDSPRLVPIDHSSNGPRNPAARPTISSCRTARPFPSTPRWTNFAEGGPNCQTFLAIELPDLSYWIFPAPPCFQIRRSVRGHFASRDACTTSIETLPVLLGRSDSSHLLTTLVPGNADSTVEIY